MPQFVLEPIDPSHRDWNRSTHKDRCRVHAPTEDDARWYATESFDILSSRKRAGDVTLPPWTNPERARLKKVSDADIFDDGLVEVPRNDVMADWESLSDVAHLEEWDPVYHCRKSVTESLEEARGDDNASPDLSDETQLGRPLVGNEDKLVTRSRLGSTGVIAAGPIGSEPLAGRIPLRSPDKARAGGTEPARWDEAEWDRTNWATEEKPEENDVIVGGEPVTVDGERVTADNERIMADGSRPSAGTAPQFATAAASGAVPRPLSRPSGAPASTEQIVRVIRQDPAHYRVQALAVLRFLEQVDAGSWTSANVHPLWGTERDTELDELLREIRDELRRFNELLAQTNASDSVLTTTTRALSERARLFLDRFVTSAVVGAGAPAGFMLFAHLYQFALDLGLEPLDSELLETLVKISN